MEWLAEKLTDLFRPWHDDGLPEELAFGEIKAWRFVRGTMGRTARLAVSLDVPFGVFGVIGIAYARRAARAWWPKERLLMEDVSCAFEPVWCRAGTGQPIPQMWIERLVLVLGRYLEYVEAPCTEEQLRESVERFIREAPRNHPGDEGMEAEQDAEQNAAADRPRE